MKALLNNKIWLFVFGFVCCSTLSSYISFKFGFPFGVPEILSLLFIPVFYPDFRFFFKVLKSNIIKVYIIFTLLLALGILFSPGNVGKVLASSRAYLYLIIFFFYGLSNISINLNKLFVISLGAVLGGYVNGIFLREIDSEAIAYSNLISFCVIISYPLIKRKYFLFVFCFFAALFVAFESSLRRIIVEILFTGIFTVLLLLLRDRILKNKLLIVILFSLPSAIMIFLEHIETYLQYENYAVWSRIFLKTRDTSTNRGLGSRVSHSNNLDNYFFDTLIPRGVYPRGVSFKVEGSIGSTLDFPLYELFYVFGSLTILFFLFFYLKLIIMGLYKSPKNPNQSDELLLMIVLFCVLVCVSFFDGGFLQYTFVTPFTGLVLGRLIFLTKNRKGTLNRKTSA